MGKSPEAKGSSVPVWPAFLALNRRFATATAWVEVMPTGLSRTSQPLTSRFLGRGAGRGGGSRFAHSPEREPSLASSIVIAVIFSLPVRVEVTADFLGMEERVDARGLFECVVATEGDLGRGAQGDAPRDLSLDEALVAIERLEHETRVLAP